MREINQEKKFNYISVIVLLNFLTNSTRPKEQFAVRQCVRFSADPKIFHDKSVKSVLNYLKGMATQGLILKPDPEKDIECYVDAEFTVR